MTTLKMDLTTASREELAALFVVQRATISRLQQGMVAVVEHPGCSGHKVNVRW